ncbi:hypothetical protein BABINDRAFT_163133 [Babjeviella inositovora NRRL Y-12698]|uniref:SAP domain-containing protein n=1 Tax=Babjeviella inositovora NRRL Y-12698 TaxID=984486 RepID=A0A1E3QMA6_9ASCO|nr:uncharacterized protein BABINDRAFT_163133 [Babjeviella inositovora NRRL Y-12698]ODQ78117.1 hypothetical protein BABINDRAFT_163133 [Babjeviella inositovora NRRL Y-12698]
MKLSKVVLTLTATWMVAAHSAASLHLTRADRIAVSSKIFERWDRNDINEFLDDHNVPYNTASSDEELKSLALWQYEKMAADYARKIAKTIPDLEKQSLFAKLKQHVLNVKEDASAIADHFGSNWDYFFHEAEKATQNAKDSIDSVKAKGEQATDRVKDSANAAKASVIKKANDVQSDAAKKVDDVTNQVAASKKKAKDSYESITSWVFDTWSTATLKSYLKANDIKFKADETKKQLVIRAKKNYRTIADANKATGWYPGNWLYKAWTEEDLAAWLKKFGIPFASGSSKNELVSKVKNNIYLATRDKKDSYSSFLDDLELSDADIFDRAGKVKRLFIETWSESQLREWLADHEVDDLGEKALETKEQLVAYVEEHSSDLVFDIQSWLASASKTASPWLSKASKKSNLVNHTFLVDVDKWPKDRLKAFLKARGVSIPLFATKLELVYLVKKNANTLLGPNVQNLGDIFFQGWETDKIKDWLTEHKLAIDGNREVLLERARQWYADLKGNADELANEQFHKGTKAAQAAGASAYSAAEEWADAVETHAAKGKEYVGIAAESVKKHVEKGAKAASQAAEDALSEASELADAAKPHISTGLEKGASAVSKAAQDALSGASELADAAKPHISTGLEKGAEYASKAADEAVKQAANAAEAAKPHIEKGAQYAKEAGAEALNHAANAANDAKDFVAAKAAEELNAKTLGKRYEDIKSGTSKWWSDLAKAGSDHFDSWSDGDLISYLKSFGYSKRSTAQHSREDLLRLVKENAGYFFGTTHNSKDGTPGRFGGHSNVVGITLTGKLLVWYKQQVYAWKSYLVPYWPFSEFL